MLASSISAGAQGIRLAQARGLGAACLPDYMRLCRGVPAGGGRIILCLNARAEELSQTCFQALALRGLEFAAALKACRPDFERLCSQTPAGLGRGLACLVQNTNRRPLVGGSLREATTRSCHISASAGWTLVSGLRRRPESIARGTRKETFAVQESPVLGLAYLGNAIAGGRLG